MCVGPVQWAGGAGPGRPGISATLRNVAAAASPSGVAAVAAAASPPGLDCGCACAVPRRARRSGTRSAGGTRGRRGPADLIKVYTWFAHWCAADKQSLLKVQLSVCKRWKKVYMAAKKVYIRGYETAKKVYIDAKKVYISHEKVYNIFKKKCQKVHMK